VGNEQWAMGNGQWAMGNGQPASQEQGMSLLQAFEAANA
jgi:hypothetical protein